MTNVLKSSKFLEKMHAKDAGVKAIVEVANEGYIPLGKIGLNNYVWSKYKECLVKVTDTSLNKNFLCTAFGFQFFEDNFSYYNEQGKKAYDITGFGKQLNDECRAKGLYTVDKIKGSGIFEDPDGDDDLIINSDELWGTRMSFDGERVINKTVFEQCLNLKIKENSNVATQAQIFETLDTLKTFNFVKENSPRLYLGWMVCGFFAGALKWRTHANVTARKGSGKSKLLGFTKNFLGPFAVNCDGESSEAGIRQKVRNSALTLLIDESEASGEKQAKILTMLRGASQGENPKLMGTSNQDGLSFEIIMQGLLVGVVPPALSETDKSRFLIMELTVKEKTPLTDLLKDESKTSKYGKEIAMLVIKNFKLFTKCANLVRLCVDNYAPDTRTTDTYSMPIAMSFFLLNFDKIDALSAKIRAGNMTELEAMIDEYVKSLSLSESMEISEEREEQSFYNEILKTQIFDGAFGNKSVIELCHASAEPFIASDDRKAITDAMGRYGLAYKHKENRLYVHASSPELRALIKNPRYKNADLMFILKRVEGAQIKADRVTIGGVQCMRKTVVSLNVEINNNDE